MAKEIVKNLIHDEFHIDIMKSPGTKRDFYSFKIFRTYDSAKFGKGQKDYTIIDFKIDEYRKAIDVACHEIAVLKGISERTSSKPEHQLVSAPPEQSEQPSLADDDIPF